MKEQKNGKTSRIEPTRSELEILAVLWSSGPSTVRFVMEELNKIRDLNYTATLRLMQLMVDKGILKRDETRMQHVYHVIEPQQKTKHHLLSKVLDSVFQGSAPNLMMQLVASKKTTKEDIRKMKEILEQFEKKA